MSTPLEDWQFYKEQIRKYLYSQEKKFASCECDLEPFFDELERRKNMSDPLVDDYYSTRSGPEKIKMPGESDQEAYDLLRKVAGRLNRWATQSSEGGWSTHQVEAEQSLADEIYAFLGKKGK